MIELGRGLAAALLSALALGMPAAGQGSMEGRGESRGEMVPSLVVAGRGEVRAAPDEATVRLGVLAQAATAAAAQQQANQTVTAMLQALRGMGVRQEQIRTSELSLSPVFAPVRPQGGGAGEDLGPRIVGYQASNTMTVTLDKLDQVGAVVDASLKAGANRLEGVAFGLRHDEAARQAALRDAAAQARSKAAALAAAMHVRLVEVLEVREEGTAAPQPRYEAMRMSVGTALATPVSSGQLDVSAAVTVRFRIAPCPAQGGCGETP